MRLRRCAIVSRLEGGELLFYPYVVYYGSLQPAKATLRCVVDRAKMQITHAYPYITKQGISVAYVPESEDRGYRP